MPFEKQQKSQIKAFEQTSELIKAGKKELAKHGACVGFTLIWIFGCKEVRGLNTDWGGTFVKLAIEGQISFFRLVVKGHPLDAVAGVYKAMGLDVCNEESMTFKTVSKAEDLLRKNARPGHFGLLFCHYEDKEIPPHVVALAYTKDGWVFFDPNLGVYKVEHLKQFLSDYDAYLLRIQMKITTIHVCLVA